MRHPNRASKTKNKKGSSCALCKPHKNGWGPARKIKEVYLMKEINKKYKEEDFYISEKND
ncbi:MAG: hypothetical protein M0P71_01080 [Melioribacteraceae bacterium]|nr:hypothetical protein [Melioribacteraceae bacterium]